MYSLRFLSLSAVSVGFVISVAAWATLAGRVPAGSVRGTSCASCRFCLGFASLRWPSVPHPPSPPFSLPFFPFPPVLPYSWFSFACAVYAARLHKLRLQPFLLSAFAIKSMHSFPFECVRPTIKGSQLSALLPLCNFQDHRAPTCLDN